MKTKKIRIETRKSKRRSFIHRHSVRIAFAAISPLIYFSFACTPRAFEKPKIAAPSANEAKTSSFETDLQTMKTAGFEFVFVFRRKDGIEFDGEDRKYLRANAPAETNRFVSSDDGKAFIAGSKYPFSPQILNALRMRFNVEDFSLPKTTK